MEALNSGKVKFFNESKGWGFITNSKDNTDVFFHVSNTLDRIKTDDLVNFNIEIGKRGPKAVMIRRAK